MQETTDIMTVLIISEVKEDLKKDSSLKPMHVLHTVHWNIQTQRTDAKEFLSVKALTESMLI